MTIVSLYFYSFFFNDTATTEIYTLSLHDALPIWARWRCSAWWCSACRCCASRSEEHTSELQSRRDLVCRLLLEKKKKSVCSKTQCHQNSRSTHEKRSEGQT